MQVKFPPEHLRTTHLTLRRPTLADAEQMFDAYASDPEATRYLEWRPYVNVADLRRYVREILVPAWETGRGHRAWLIERRDIPGVIGAIGFAMRHASCVSVGYVLGHGHWGQGLMTEALRAVCDRALADPKIYRVEAICHPDNVASSRVMEKSGMSYEGRLKRFFAFPNLGPEPVDCLLYARVKEE